MAAGESQDDLSTVVALLREISRCTDPEAMVHAYAKRRNELIPIDRSVALSRRDLQAPLYRITRSDLWKQTVNPWTQKDLLPVLSGGLLGELLYGGEPRIVESIQIAAEDPAAEYFADMGSLIAIPHYDGGAALNMVIHMRKERNGFDPARFPYFVLLSGLFGRATKELVVATELEAARSALHDQYLAVAQLSDTVLEQARLLKAHADTLEDRVAERTAELEAAHLDAIYILAMASEEKDHTTSEHLRRMQGLTARVSQLVGLAETQARTVAQAAVLHDIGKLHVPDQILKKSGPLTPQERSIMQDHTIAGERILPDRPYFAAARRVARSHHENWDGSGYPDGLRGEVIPLEARIVHLVDVYDALTNVRPYKSAWTAAAARDFVRQQRGLMFDPALVDVFMGAETNSPSRQASES
jgi:HD-GYP domain-containing protein (c-di-GMP phosphodiesterase class II)